MSVAAPTYTLRAASPDGASYLAEVRRLADLTCAHGRGELGPLLAR
jgi:hypothetical protein